MLCGHLIELSIALKKTMTLVQCLCILQKRKSALRWSLSLLLLIIFYAIMRKIVNESNHEHKDHKKLIWLNVRLH